MDGRREYIIQSLDFIDEDPGSHRGQVTCQNHKKALEQCSLKYTTSFLLEPFLTSEMCMVQILVL